MKATSLFFFFALVFFQGSAFAAKTCGPSLAETPEQSLAVEAKEEAVKSLRKRINYSEWRGGVGGMGDYIANKMSVDKLQPILAREEKELAILKAAIASDLDELLGTGVTSDKLREMIQIREKLAARNSAVIQYGRWRQGVSADMGEWIALNMSIQDIDKTERILRGQVELLKHALELRLSEE